MLMSTAAVIGLLLRMLLSIIRRASVAWSRYTRIASFLRILSMSFVGDPSIVAVVNASRINYTTMGMVLMLRTRPRTRTFVDKLYILNRKGWLLPRVILR